MDKDYFESLKNAVQEPEQPNSTSVKSSGMATLTVKVDIDCKLYCDGDFLDLFEANKVKKVQIPKGQHLMTIESELYDEISEDQVLDASEEGKNYLLMVKGMKEKEDVLVHKQEEARRQQEEEKKRIKMEAEKKQKEQEENNRHQEIIRIQEEERKKQEEAKDYYLKGKEFYNKKNHSEAVKCFKESAERGNSDAQYKLGYCYEYGYGVPKDKEEAVKLYKKSADQGNPDGQCKYGDCLFYGRGIAKNEVESIKWFKMAAEKDNYNANKMLDYFRRHGYKI